MASTKTMDRIAPTNAAVIIISELNCIALLKERIISSATASLAPDEIPSTKGPAIGFLKKLCKRYPDSASAPPRSIAASALGSLILPMIPAVTSGTFLPRK